MNETNLPKKKRQFVYVQKPNKVKNIPNMLKWFNEKGVKTKQGLSK
jgi:hypothetical protein